MLLCFGRCHLSTIAVQHVLLAGLMLKMSWRLLLAAYQVWAFPGSEMPSIWGYLSKFVHFQQQCGECKVQYKDYRVFRS